MEESLAHVVEVSWPKFNKHLKFRFLHLFKDVLLIVGLEKLSLSSAASRRPRF